MPTSSASLEIKGIEELYRKLNKVAAAQTLRPPMIEALTQDVRPEAQDYPPERPGQTYVRTYTLRDGWSRPPVLQATPNGLEGRLGNETKYGPYVQGHDTQAWMHRGRWQTNLSILRKLEPRIANRFKRAIEKALK